MRKKSFKFNKIKEDKDKFNCVPNFIKKDRCQRCEDNYETQIKKLKKQVTSLFRSCLYLILFICLCKYFS